MKPSKVEVDQGGVKVGFCIFDFLDFKSWNFGFGWGGPRRCQDQKEEKLVFVVVVKVKVHWNEEKGVPHSTVCIFKDDVKWIGREEVSGELGGRSLVKFPPGLAQREELSRRGQGSLQGEGRSFRHMSHFEGTRA